MQNTLRPEISQSNAPYHSLKELSPLIIFVLIELTNKLNVSFQKIAVISSSFFPVFFSTLADFFTHSKKKSEPSLTWNMEYFPVCWGLLSDPERKVILSDKKRAISHSLSLLLSLFLSTLSLSIYLSTFFSYHLYYSFFISALISLAFLFMPLSFFLYHFLSPCLSFSTSLCR